MEKALAEYKLWCEGATDDSDVANELSKINGDEKGIYERFYRSLEFGTGGLRGVIGAGTNRMNIYTVRRATTGLAEYLLKSYTSPSVAIAYDSRIKSDLFASEAARILAGRGIKVHIYPHLMPTPSLSFAVRHLKCSAGIVITASHNPAKYNGYKVYGSDGCQITLEAADMVLSEIEQVTTLPLTPPPFDKLMQEGRIKYIGEDVIKAYLNAVFAQRLDSSSEPKSLKVVYSPLNGSGLMCVSEILKLSGINDVTVVEAQREPDGSFPTCPFPNPEERSALTEGLKVCAETGADLLLATDPDCDRVGTAVPNSLGEYELISGNEMGAMLFEYICIQRRASGTMPAEPIAVKTIVTTDIATKIAAKYGVKLVNVLTGFKFIGEQIGLLEKEGRAESYIFGFEESYGYLAGSYVRDKDAVVASMLICEMAEFYRKQGLSLLDVRDKMYREYGRYLHTLDSFTFEGAEGSAKMAQLMKKLRTSAPADFGGHSITCLTDYLTPAQGSALPPADVLQFDLEGGFKVIMRPSGTEPKIKIYTTTLGLSLSEAKQLSDGLRAAVKEFLTA